MTQQLAIDFNAVSHARRGDPETSKEAASRLRSFAAGQCAEILTMLHKYGPLSPEQIAAKLSIDKVAVCRRLPDLQKASKARPTGLTTGTIAGRRQRIWEAV